MKAKHRRRKQTAIIKAVLRRPSFLVTPAFLRWWVKNNCPDMDVDQIRAWIEAAK
jgi:hypothetical protein